MPGVDPVALLPSVADHPVLWLFVAGHLVGDFLLQTDWIAANKWRPGVLFLHVGIVAAAHLVVLVPFLGFGVGVAVGFLAAAHLAIDFVKVRVMRGERGPGSLPLFVGDQAVHLAAIVVAVHLLSTWAPPTPHLSEAAVATWAAVALTLGVFAFAWTGGDTLVRTTLASVSGTLQEEAGAGLAREDGLPGSGRVIGILERTIALILIVLGEWAAIVLLVAVKSIARFEALKKRHFAEYYLIGTLTSLLVAILSGLLLTAVVFGE